MGYEYSDAGRSTSKRPKQKNDCTVRALALAVGMEYDEAYDLLKRSGRKASQRFHFKEWIFGRKIKGCIFAWRSFPAVKGEKRMNPWRFCEENPEGTWILKTAKHVFTVKDGVILDDHKPRADRCVYAAWQVIYQGE